MSDSPLLTDAPLSESAVRMGTRIWTTCRRIFSPAADADSIDDMADDMIEMTDEEGNTTLFKILDYFFYNGDEYAILTDSIDEGTTGADRVDCYVMKIVPTTDESGEELEEFVPVEDQKLEAKLMEIATLKLNDDEQADDED